MSEKNKGKMRGGEKNKRKGGNMYEEKSNVREG